MQSFKSINGKFPEFRNKPRVLVEITAHAKFIYEEFNRIPPFVSLYGTISTASHLHSIPATDLRRHELLSGSLWFSIVDPSKIPTLPPSTYVVILYSLLRNNSMTYTLISSQRLYMYRQQFSNDIQGVCAAMRLSAGTSAEGSHAPSATPCRTTTYNRGSCLCCL
jgi:hypothetical protein